MKRRALFALTLVLALLLCGCAQNVPAPTSAPTAIAAPSAVQTPEPTAAPEPTPTEKPVSPEVQARLDENKAVWREMHNRPCMEGRLLVPSVGIDVALFNEGENLQNKSTEVLRQDVVDAEDSALLYYDDPVGNIIADHSNQDFAKLPGVKVGDAAYILSGDRMVTLECVFTTDGVNTGYGITDTDGGWHHDDADYVCYTCLEDWTHIQMVGFAMKDEDFFDMDWIDVSETTSTTTSTTSTSSNADRGVATSISLPAPTDASGNTAAAPTQATPAPSAAPAPSATPAATVQQTAAPLPAPPQEPANYDTIPGYDIYADADSTWGIYYSNGVDSYLG